MRIFEITGFVDRVADVMADPKADPIEELSNHIKSAGHKVQDQVIELLKADLNIKIAPQKPVAGTAQPTATTKPVAGAAQSTAQAQATTQPAPAAKSAV